MLYKIINKLLTFLMIFNQLCHQLVATLKDLSAYLLELIHIFTLFSHIQFAFGIHYL